MLAVIQTAHDNDFEYALLELANISIYTSVGIHAFFLMTRLFHTFNETTYRIGDNTMKMMVGCTIVLLLLFLVGVSASYLFSYKLMEIFGFLFWITVGLQQIYISHLFSSRLFAITLHIRKTRLSNHQILNKRQTSLLKVIAKQTLLSRIESIFLALVVVFAMLADTTSNEILPLLFQVFMTLYFICLSITIQLSFVYSDKYYYRCCSSCHQFCLNYYQRRTIKALKSSTKYQQNLIQEKSSQENTTEMHIKTESKQSEYVALNDSANE